MTALRIQLLNTVLRSQRHLHRIGDKPYLGTRLILDGTAGEYNWLTYRAVAERVENLASGLESLEIGDKSNVGLYSVNRLEWTLGEYACYHLK